MEEIDFVLPWVDGEDKKWQEEKSLYKPAKDNPNGNHKARFRDFGTLKYVLRAIEQNAPWYNRIYLITQGHYPKWLNIHHPKIKLVTHKELYFNTSHLPTFNSSSIEMNLANLKDIKEKFIYLNDDMVILNKVSIDRFFKNNKAVDFLSHHWLPRNRIFDFLRGKNRWRKVLNNNLDFINRKFAPLKFEKKYLYNDSYSYSVKVNNFLLDKFYKRFIWLEHWHHPQAYFKNTIKEVYNEFKEEMMRVSSHKFRTNQDLNHYLYRYWHLAKEEFYPFKYDDGFVVKVEKFRNFQKDIQLLEKRDNINFVCFNDQMYNSSDEEFFKAKSLLKTFLDKRLATPASFEKF